MNTNTRLRLLNYYLTFAEYLFNYYSTFAEYLFNYYSTFAEYLFNYYSTFTEYLFNYYSKFTNLLLLFNFYVYSIRSVPICCVQWVRLDPVNIKINCCIGVIPMAHWRSWGAEEHPQVSSFISFSDLQPSRYALSYINEPNENAYVVRVAFIAVDSENIGEMVNDMYHVDFGDNKFPFFKGNTNKHIDSEKFSNNDSDSEDEEESILHQFNQDEVANISKYIPKSILEFMCTKI